MTSTLRTKVQLFILMVDLCVCEYLKEKKALKILFHIPHQIFTMDLSGNYAKNKN